MIFRWKRLQNVQMPSVIIITELILLKKLTISQTFTTAISAPMEMSDNQMQPQTTVSESNSKALSIKKYQHYSFLFILCKNYIWGARSQTKNITPLREPGLLQHFNLTAYRCSDWRLWAERNDNHLQLKTFLIPLHYLPFLSSLHFFLLRFLLL